MNHFTPMQPGTPSYRSAIVGGWQLLKNRFLTLSGALITFMIILGAGFVLEFMLNAAGPAYTNLWRFPFILGIILLDMGLFRLLAKALTNQPWSIGNLFWAFKKGEAWVLALLNAAIGSILEAYAGLPMVRPGQKLPADWFAHPQIWIILTILGFLGIFFGYVFILYAAYSVNAKKALSSSLHIFGKKWKWLLFPLLLTLILLIAFIGIGIAVGLLFAIFAFLMKYIGIMLIGKIALVIFGVIILIAFYIAIFIWVYGSLLIASGALVETETQLT